MKKFFNSIALAVVAIASVSCAMSNQVMLPSTALDKGNYVYARNVSAKISYTYILGFGGLSYKDVVEKLIENASLAQGEALVNVGIQTKFKCYLGLVMKRDIIATGQVVRFTDGNSENSTISSLQEKFEELSIRMSGYDGDLLSAFPVSAVNVKIEKQAELGLSKYGVSLTPESISETIISSLTKNNQSAFDAAAQNVMNVILIRCEKDGNVHGFAEIKDKNGETISNIVIDGASIKKAKTPEDLFLAAFANAGKKIYSKWNKLYSENAKVMKVDKK